MSISFNREKSIVFSGKRLEPNSLREYCFGSALCGSWEESPGIKKKPYN
jgi:hypothetical protein